MITEKATQECGECRTPMRFTTIFTEDEDFDESDTNIASLENNGTKFCVLMTLILKKIGDALDTFRVVA